ncbi:MAG: dihydroorotase [bacterium]|nr:dihydroorotase [bacterium]
MIIVVKNGNVVLGDKLIEKNIVIKDGKIKDITNEKVESFDEVIDAKNNIVIPGVIDPHVHFRDPGATWKEDFFSGSKAAAAGGVTTVLDMPNTNPMTISQKFLDEKRELAKKSIVNYGFHIGATKDNLEELKKIKGVASVKVYMGSSTGDLLVDNDFSLRNVFSLSDKIIAVHAEDEKIIKMNTEKYKNEKKPSIHGKIRSNECAASAVKKAISFSDDKQLYVCHMSTAEEVELVRNANRKVYCEATPHHLFLTKEALDNMGNYAKMNPPLRSAKDVAALWKAIEDGVIDTIGTDHAPHTREEKEQDYWKAPAGVPGVETMLPLLLDAVNKNRLSLKRLIDITSGNVAKIFRIKNKGAIEKGFDADITIIDMNKENVIKDENLRTKCGWSPFNRLHLNGAPVKTIVNGNVVYDGNDVIDKKAEEVEYNERS